MQIVAQGDPFAERVGDVADGSVPREVGVRQCVLEILPGEDPHHHVVRIDDRVFELVAGADRRQRAREGGFRQYDRRVFAVGVLHRQALQDSLVGAVADALAPADQPLGVYRLGVQPFGHNVRQRAPQHEWQDQTVVVGHFQDHEDRGQRRVGGAAHEGCHPDQAEGNRFDPQPGEHGVEAYAHCRAECPADDQRRREHPADPAARQRQSRQGNLGHRQQHQHPRRLSQDQPQIHALVSASPQPGLELARYRADHHRGEHQPEPARELVQQVVDLPHAAVVEHGHDAAQQAEHGVQEQIAGGTDGVFLGDGNDQVFAQADAGHRRRRHAGDDHGRQPEGPEAPDDFLERKEHPGDGSAEGSRNTGRRPATDQQLEPVGTEPEEAPDATSQRRPEDRHRSLRADRTAAAERDRRCHCLEHDRDGVEHAAAACHRVHHVGDVLARRVLGAEVDDPPDDGQTEGEGGDSGERHRDPERGGDTGHHRGCQVDAAVEQ